MRFTIDVEDEAQLSGITAARVAYNEINPQNILETDQAYFEWFMSSVFANWGSAHTTSKKQAAYDAFDAGDTSLLKAMIEVVDKQAEEVKL